MRQHQSPTHICQFVLESNRIEGIEQVRSVEIAEMERFLAIDAVSIGELEQFVSVYQPDAMLRRRRGLDVFVGDHVPPPGGPEIVPELERIIAAANGGEPAWRVHVHYETLHPFTDGNGRSGRALWAWQMARSPSGIGLARGFLHEFYYQTLSQTRIP